MKVTAPLLARLGGCLVFASSVLAVPYCTAEDWKPRKNVEIITGASPGGGNDLLARRIQKILQDKRLISVTSSIINKVGGGMSEPLRGATASRRLRSALDRDVQSGRPRRPSRRPSSRHARSPSPRPGTQDLRSTRHSLRSSTQPRLTWWTSSGG